MRRRQGAGRPRSSGLRGWPGLLSLLLGVLLLAVGVGVGLRWLAKTGWTPASVVGLAALVAGAVLTAAGVTGLTCTPHGWWRLPAAGATVLAAATGVYVLAVPLSAAVVPPTAVGDRTPASVGLVHREVRLPTADGARLAAWYTPPRNGGAVVLLHGSGSTKAAVLEHAAVLAGHGYGVLMPDARGHGASTGRGMDWGWHGDADVRAAVTFLAADARVDPDRIAAVGLSMGGEEAIGAAAADPRIRAVVAEGVTARSAEDLAWLSHVYGWRGRVQEGLEALRTSIAETVSGVPAPTPLRAAARQAAPRPLLLVVAGERPDEQHAAADIQGSAPGSVRVWVVPGSGHTGGLRTDPDGWEARVLAFLDAETS